MLMAWVKIKNDLVKLQNILRNRIELSNDKGKSLLLGRIMNCRSGEQRMLNICNNS